MPSDLAAAFRRVRIGKLTGKQVARVYALKQEDRCRRLTARDLSAFVLAQELGATLLTNDDDLRRLASCERVDCHGVLWLLDVLVSQRRILPSHAVDALENMLTHGAWLPRHECAKRLVEWRR